MPFAGDNAHSVEIFREAIPKRLGKNAKLRSELADGMKEGVGESWTGMLVPELQLPFDGDKLLSLFALIAKGLAYWHWNIFLDPETSEVQSGILLQRGSRVFESLFCMRAAQRVTGRLGDGLFIYEGAQAVDKPVITLWKMSMYGAVFGNESVAPGKRYSIVYASAAPTGKCLPLTSRD